ncbi:MAG: ankyrin repeat domain-containing protein [Planctomycetes bacterium]|nr:ankyrin repeat domain-containing protein [Planctomycetota bacterium]
MRRTASFILLCLLFGALLSVAVAWWATLREWENEEFFGIEQNGWTAAMVQSPASTAIVTVQIGDNIPDEQFGYSLERFWFPDAFRYLTKASPPAWFPLSIEPATESAMTNGFGAGWPLTCVIFIQELESESYFPEWDLVTHGGIVGTNPFSSAEDNSLNNNRLPLRVVPMGFFVDALIYSLGIAFPVLVFRLTLYLRAKHHQRHKRCPHCKYDLSRSTTVLCTECGADPMHLPPFISRSTIVLTGVVTILFLIALIGFGVVFSARLPYSQLHYAAYHGDIRVVRNELAAGEDIDDAAPTNNWSGLDFTYTPLMLACAGGETEVLQYLIDAGAGLEVRSSFGTTVLHMAINSGSIDCVSLLLENGADPNAKVSADKDALWLIANSPDADPRLLEVLLEAGYRLEPGGGDTDEAISMAIANGNEKFIHRLLKLGAVPGYGSLRAAVGNGRVDWLELFVRNGADLGLVSIDGWPILHAVSPDEKPREIVEFLIQHGQHIDSADGLGVTGLMVAAALESADLCRIFLDFGADPNLRDDSGMNALDHAIEFRLGNIEGLVSVLLDAGAEVRLVDEKGEPRFDDLDPDLLKLLQENAASKSKERQPGQ